MQDPKSFALGSWRLFLAALVATSHLWGPMIPGYAAYAVWGFFVLSGYLMTYILTQRYHFTRLGLLHYTRNRFVRIYPTYWLALALGIFALAFLTPRGITPAKLNAAFQFPRSKLDWIFPFTLCIPFPSYFLPVPVSKALGIEVAYYCLMPLFALSRTTTWLCLFAGLFYNIYLYSTDADFYQRYMAFLPCVLPFATGSLCCHYRHELAALRRPFTSTALWILHGLAFLYDPTYPWFYGLLVSIGLSAWVTISLAIRKSSRVDSFLGDLSYPVYLLHTTVAAFFIIPFGYDRNLPFFVAAFSSTILVSALIVRYFEKPIRLLRYEPAHALARRPYGPVRTRAPHHLGQDELQHAITVMGTASIISDRTSSTDDLHRHSAESISVSDDRSPKPQAAPAYHAARPDRPRR